MANPEGGRERKGRDLVAAAALAFLLGKACLGSTPTVHVRAERAKLTEQLDEQVVDGELVGEELYVETFITDHVVTDGGSGIAGLGPDDERDLSPRGVQPWLDGTLYDPGNGAQVSESDHTVAVDPADDGPVISISFSGERFGEFELNDEATEDVLSRQGYPYQIPLDDPRQN